MMVPVGSTADGEPVPARPWQVCGCPPGIGVARWVPPVFRGDDEPYAWVYWSIDECLGCGASWVSYPEEEP